MKKRMIITMAIIMSMIMAEALASSVTRTYNDSNITNYVYTNTGSSSTLRSSSRVDSSMGRVCESFIRNTSSVYEDVTVKVKEINDYVGGTSKSASNNNLIGPSEGVGCYPITRASGHSNFHYVHSGKVINYQTRATMDTYEITIDQ